MTGDQFLRKVRRLSRETGMAVRLDTKQGKGSHGTLWYGDRRTVMKDRKKEIGAGLLRAMLDQLGIDPKEFD